MIRIYHDKAKTQEIEQKLIDKYASRKKKAFSQTGYNVSECSSCEMKCYCRRTGLEEKFTKQSVGFLVFGIVTEDIVMGIFNEDERQYKANLADIIFGHLDVFENHIYPIEGKATAKRIFKREQLPQIWVMQLINYITMTGATKGWLLILDIFTRSFSAWCVEIGEEERLMQIEALMDKVSRFNLAIGTKDPSFLSITPEDYALCNFKHECPRRPECRKQANIIKEKEKSAKEMRKKYNGGK